MSHARRSQLILLLLTSLFAPRAAAQFSSGFTEARLSAALRSEVLQKNREIVNTPANALAQSVLQQLTSTPFAENNPRRDASYHVILLDSPEINAFAIGSGDVFVYKGLMPLLGNTPGYWAAVLGHETGHNLAHHVYQKYTREMAREAAMTALQLELRKGKKSAAYELLALQLAGNLLMQKFSRDQENQADHLGLQMMVQAGYHPDFMLSLYRQMQLKLGDQGRFAALFSDHPTWNTREERTEKFYQQALAEFHQRWPNAELSPGGEPPPVADLGTPDYSLEPANNPGNNPNGSEVLVQVPLEIRHDAGLPTEVLSRWIVKKKKFPVLHTPLDIGINDLNTNVRIAMPAPPGNPKQAELVVGIKSKQLLDVRAWKLALRGKHEVKKAKL